MYHVWLFQIELPIPIQIEGIVTKGDPNTPEEFTDSYRVSYTPDGETWYNITDEEGNPVVSVILVYLCFSQDKKSHTYIELSSFFPVVGVKTNRHIVSEILLSYFCFCGLHLNFEKKKRNSFWLWFNHSKYVVIFLPLKITFKTWIKPWKKLCLIGTHYIFQS